MRTGRPWSALAVVALLLAAACGGEDAERPGATQRPAAPVELSQVPPSPPEAVPSALEDRYAPGLPPPLIDPVRIVPGGPPPDGIPAIDHPRFERPAGVDWLDEREPVVALELGGEARAYPVQVLVWHEIVNDTLAGVPVAVTYCPLCNSAVALERRLGDRVLDFGTSGQLLDSALVAYDRQTRSLWEHFTGRAVVGALAGAELRLHPVATVSWGEWRRAHPDAWVLSRRTGHDRPYGTNPYPGYDDVENPPFRFEGRTDARLAAKARVLGLRRGDDAVAILAEHLLAEEVVEADVGGAAVVALAKAGTSSALEADRVAEGRDVGATAVFEASLDGTRLRLAPDGDGGFFDSGSGTTFDLFGRGSGGRLAGRRLTAVEHVDTFWFAWAAYRPASRILPAPAAGAPGAGPGFVCGRVQFDVPECQEVAPPG